MNKIKILNMVKFSTLAAITLLLSLVPQIGFITVLPGVSITIVHIPVLIGIMSLSLSYSIGLGLVFGLGSLSAAFLYASNPFDVAMQNPLLSVVPRVLFAIAAFFIVHGLRLLLKKIKHDKLVASIIVTVMLGLFLFLVGRVIIIQTGWSSLYVYLIGSVILLLLVGLYLYIILSNRYKEHMHVPTSFIISTFVHSILVLTFVALLKPDIFGDSENLFGLILATLSFNGVIESLVAALIGTPIVVALSQLEERNA